MLNKTVLLKLPVAQSQKSFLVLFFKKGPLASFLFPRFKMRITQGCFSFLPDLTDVQISKQVQYCLDHGWAVSFEYTDDPHPRNTYWEMWGHPMFDIRDAKAVMGELAACRRMHEECYIRLCAFDSTHTWESLRLSFIVQRPSTEPGFMLSRHEAEGRTIRYETRAYVMEKPEGSRYGE